MKFFINIIENHKRKSNFSAPWQETFADAGDGDGDGGRGEQFRSILLHEKFSKFENVLFGGGGSKYIFKYVHIYRK